MQNGVQSHFDYISNVQKTVRADGSVGYDVSVGRFECMDIPGTTELFHGPSQPSPIFNQQPPQAAPAQAFVNQPQPQPFIPPQQNFVPQSFAQPAAAAAAPSYYYPYAAAASSYYCFTADTKVRVMGGSEKRMDELNKYDWVQSLTETEIKYVPVSFWLHRVPTQVAEFMKISLADGNELKITKSHFIYKTECSDEGEQEIDFDQVSHAEVTAGKVNKGDCLYTVASSGKPMATRVTKIETVTETGIYAPMTANGKIVVNGVHASCHSVVKSHALQNAYFEWAEYFQNKFSSLFTRSEENEKHLPFSVDAVFSLMSLAVPGGLKEL